MGLCLLMVNEERQGSRHPIGVVAQRTGLTLETLRAWERRYAAVRPARTDGQQRLYTDADVERLQLLRGATQAGWGIGRVAGLTTGELRALVPGPAAGADRGGGAEPGEADPFVARALRAVRRLDGAALEAELRHAQMVLGVMGFAEGVVLPLLRELGSGWVRGELGIAHEHLASAVLRRLLGELITRSDMLHGAPVLVAATLSGQMHELGVLLAGVAAAAAGWRVVYLGADLPAEEIAGAAHTTGARVAAISLVYPLDDACLPDQLRRLRAGLGATVLPIVGGAGAAGLTGLLEGLGYRVVADLAALRACLDAARRSDEERCGVPCADAAAVRNP
jgi:MerR family transcriptional regulator, light-induced transcriptional regulator